MNIEKELDELARRRDFAGIGNRVLETLTKCRDRESSDGKIIAQKMKWFVAQKFGIPDEITYAIPHRDEYLPPYRRGDWETDVVPCLIILAYTIGATWKSLPRPDDKLVPYYLLMAERQKAIIEAIKKEAPPRAAYTRRINPDLV